MTFLIQSREAFEHNTDPQRRCYNGCHYSSEWRWGPWRTLGERKTQEEAEARAQEWREYQEKFGGTRKLEYRSIEENSHEQTS